MSFGEPRSRTSVKSAGSPASSFMSRAVACCGRRTSESFTTAAHLGRRSQVSVGCAGALLRPVSACSILVFIIILRFLTLRLLASRRTRGGGISVFTDVVSGLLSPATRPTRNPLKTGGKSTLQVHKTEKCLFLLAILSL